MDVERIYALVLERTLSFIDISQVLNLNGVPRFTYGLNLSYQVALQYHNFKNAFLVHLETF